MRTLQSTRFLRHPARFFSGKLQKDNNKTILKQEEVKENGDTVDEDEVSDKQTETFFLAI